MSENNSEQIYCEIIRGLYNLYIDKICNEMKNATSHYLLENNIESNGYWSLIQLIYEKFYLLENVDFSEFDEFDEFYGYSRNEMMKYIPIDFFNIPNCELTINDNNQYKKIFNQLMLCYKEYNEFYIKKYINKIKRIFDSVSYITNNPSDYLKSVSRTRQLFKKTLEKSFTIEKSEINELYELAGTDEVRLKIIELINNKKIRSEDDIELSCWKLKKLISMSDYLKCASFYECIKDYKEAENTYTKLIESDKSNSEYYCLRARFYKKIEDYERAEVDYTKAVELQKNVENSTFNRYHERAEFYEKFGEYKKAELDYIKLTQLYPDEIHEYKELAEFYERTQKFKEAEKAYTKAINIADNNWLDDTYKWRAEFFENIGEYEKAEADYKKLVELNNKNNIDLAEFYSRTNNVKNAEMQYTKKIQEHPKMSSCYLERADFYEKNKEYEKAEKDYTTIINLYPKNKNSYIYRAAFYERTNNYIKAIKDCSTLINIKPEELKYFIKRALFNEILENYTESEADYNYLIKIKPKKKLFHEIREKFYERVEYYKQLDKNFSQYKSLEPVETRSLQIKLDENEIEYDTNEYIKDIESNSKNDWDYYWKGKSHQGKKEYEKAKECYSIAIELNPYNKQYYLDRAFVYEKLNKIQKAEKDYLHIFKLNKFGSKNDYINIATFYERIGNFEKAKFNFKLAKIREVENDLIGEFNLDIDNWIY